MPARRHSRPCASLAGATLAAVLVVLSCQSLGAQPVVASAGATVRVMSFNMWHGGDAGGQPLEQSLAVVRAAAADVVGLQETHGLERDGVRPDHGARLASLLGWHYLDQGHRTGILSRWPIVGTHGERAGVTVRLPSGRELHVFNVHLAHAPYQPYQLLRIPYEDAPFLTTADELVDAARAARGPQIEPVLAQIRPLLEQGEVVVLTGDFNEPSHLDWTTRASAAGRVPLVVPYPTTQAVTATGMRDAFRTLFPDEVRDPGYTWTPTTAPSDPKDRHDRIDFVFAGGATVEITSCEVVGEASATAHVVLRPWPSDHRAVVAAIRISPVP